MLQRSTIQLLRFHFSFFLLPVYLFALGAVSDIDFEHATLVFVILHLLVYPSSNGYNSYMDRDTESIGGIKYPSQPTRQLFVVTIIMDILALALGLIISNLFFLLLTAYILASKAYSYRGIRLKKYPFVGFMTVIVFQGAVTFFLVYHGSSIQKNADVPLIGMIASSLLVGGFYPLTQIYQHQADKRDGVITLSYLLGYRGTFVFSAVLYIVALGTLFLYFDSQDQQKRFYVLAAAMTPILFYFFGWANKVWRDERAADFSHTMRMNIVASCCTNIGFLIIIIGRLI